MIQIDIPMPEKCGVCPCFHFENLMYCQAVKADKSKKIVAPYGQKRPEWCPLKEQEAKQVIGIADSFEGMEVGYCPSCDRIIVNKKIDETKFCKFCGQAVKWDEKRVCS